MYMLKYSINHALEMRPNTCAETKRQQRHMIKKQGQVSVWVSLEAEPEMRVWCSRFFGKRPQEAGVRRQGEGVREDEEAKSSHHVGIEGSIHLEPPEKSVARLQKRPLTARQEMESLGQKMKRWTVCVRGGGAHIHLLAPLGAEIGVVQGTRSGLPEESTIG